ncbi:Organic hydroperoxide resistance protein OhrA [Geobacillus sp. BCO2]|nr:Organic hydroperoxide resistance protein OhrA [Geobacillus sp. BCO2]
MQPLYQTAVKAQGGRNGKVVSDDGVLSLDVKMPKELGGSGGATNPEQLFAAGYAACFDSALNLVIRQRKAKVEGTEVTAQVTLGKDEADGGFQLAVVLQVRIWGSIERLLKSLCMQPIKCARTPKLSAAILM